MKLLLIFCLTVLWYEAFGQAPNVKGQDQAQNNYVPNILLPTKQVTKTNGTTVLLETGNDNLVADPGAEGISGNGPFTTSSTGGAIASITRNSTPYKGSKAYSLLCTAHPTTDGTCTFTVSLNTASLAGVKGIFNYWAKDNRKGADFTVGWSQNGGSVLGTKSLALNSPAWTPNRLSVEAMGATSTEVIFSVSVTGGDLPVVLIVDELDVSPDKNEAIIANVSNISEWTSFTPTGTWTTNTTYSGKWRIVGEEMEIRYSLILTGAPNASGLAVNLPSGFSVDLSKFPTNVNAFIPSGDSVGRDSSTGSAFKLYSSVRATGSSSSLNVYFQSQLTGQSTAVSNAAPVTWETGDELHLSFSVPILGWPASNPHAIFNTETFSTDYTPLWFKSTACTSEEIGCFNTYSYATPSSNAKTPCTTPPTQNTSDMATNGILVITSPFDTTTNCDSPARIEVVAGKNKKTPFPISLYKNPASISPRLAGMLNYLLIGSDSWGPVIANYDESSGVVTIDGRAHAGTVTGSSVFMYSDRTNSTSGYFTINASKTPSLAAFDLPARYVVKKYQSGTTWYEIYNDGWVRQGAQRSSGNYTFAVAMRDSNYLVTGSVVAGGTVTDRTVYFDSITSSSFSVVVTSNGGASAAGARIIIEGYGEKAALASLGVIVNY